MLNGIWNLIPTIIGLVESLLPLIKELAIVVVRILDILPNFLIQAQPIIEKINQIYDAIYAWIERIKNMLLIR